MLRFLFFLVLVYFLYIMLRKPLSRILGLFITPTKTKSPYNRQKGDPKKSASDELLDSDSEYVDYEDIPSDKDH